MSKIFRSQLMRHLEFCLRTRDAPLNRSDNAVGDAPVTLSSSTLCDSYHLTELLVQRHPWHYGRMKLGALRQMVEEVLPKLLKRFHATNYGSPSAVTIKKVADDEATSNRNPVSSIATVPAGNAKKLSTMANAWETYSAESSRLPAADDAINKETHSISMNGSIRLLYERSSGHDQTSDTLLESVSGSATALPTSATALPTSATATGGEAADAAILQEHANARRPSKRQKQSRSMVSDKLDSGSIPPRANHEGFVPNDPPPDRLSDLGGIEAVLQDIAHLVLQPLQHPEVFEYLGIQPPRGIILHGPPGSGKTKLAFAIAGECGRPFFHVAAPELVSGMSGESEALVRSLFQSAKDNAPCLLFIDEIDAITPKRESASKEMERRIVSQLSICMDNLSGAFVVVLAATNRIDSLDPMIRRNGRFDREIPLGIPDESARAKILEALCKKIRLSESIDYKLLSKRTPGFAGADLFAVSLEASLVCSARIFKTISPSTERYSTDQLSDLCICQEDFITAIKKVQPSARREGFSTIPDVTWDDVGALSILRKEMEERIVLPIKEAALYKALGLDVPAGVLLYGPPGCGKTLLAKAVANESGANFISVKGPELLNKYVGESEKAVRQLFARARISAPCMIFFDELDSLCAKRGMEGTQATERVVNQLLTEMDGVQGREGVYVIAATNRPDIIDPAMLRPGRLDRRMYVPLPDVGGRLDILRKLGRALPLGEDVELSQIAEASHSYSGADLAALFREAALLALESHRMSMAACKERICPSLSVENGEGRVLGDDSTIFSVATTDTITTFSDEHMDRPTEKSLENTVASSHEGSVFVCICMKHLLGALSRTVPSVSAREVRFFEEMSAEFAGN